MRAALLLALVASLLVGAPAPGADLRGREELERVREQARALEARLRELQAQQHELGNERQRLETELALAEVQLRESEEAQTLATASLVEARKAADDAQSALDDAVEQLQLQLGLLAVLGRAGTAPLVLRALGSGEDLERRITVSVALAEDQKRRRDEIASLAELRSRTLAQLSLRRAALDDTVRTAEQRRQQLTATRSRVVAELASLERQRRKEAMSLAGVREAEARLERLWGLVTKEGEEARGDVRLLRGGLPWPVQDVRVIGRFGKRRDAVYGTVTMLNGLLLDVPDGTDVRAISEGKVAYAQFFKGYGNLVIVHHGGEVYSLYSRLATMLVREGRRVGMGEPLGRTGPDTDGEGNLYLEIRIGRRPEDPLVWLKPMGK